MVVGVIPEMIPGGYRLAIDEVDTFAGEEEEKVEEKKEDEGVNYL